MKDFAVKLIASGFGIGYAPIVPGSWGTIPGLLIAWLLFDYGWPLQLLITGAVLAVAVWTAGLAESHYGHDAKIIVIDEIAGMLVALLFVPHRWQYYLVGFVVFRILDVWKPYPAAKWEGLPHGWGIVGDDFAVAVYTNILLQLLVLFGFWL
jgi:phosphatidylglycerophosphatase A